MTLSSPSGTSNLLPLEEPAGGRQADPDSPLGPPTGGPDPAAVDVVADSWGRATAARTV